MVQTVERSWLTVTEVAAAAQVSPATIRRWIATGELAASRFTRRGPLRIARRDVNALLAGAGGDGEWQR